MKLKKVITNNELYNKMQEAINLLCGTVKTTLGPTGNNIIIDHSTFSPFITNDGVTIAKNIESDDPVINTILELAKEASIKTDEIVGDGTTTTLVLLEEIFNQGLKLIKNGKKPILLKNEINETLKKLITLIKEKSRKPLKNDLLKIATISANDNEIGKIISTVYSKINNKNAIKLIESENLESAYTFYKGYSFETNLASSYYFNKQKEIILNQPHILLVDNYIDNPEEISLIINYIIEEKKDLIIIANEYSDLFINYIMSLYLDNDTNIYLLTTPEYGKRQKIFLTDISIISNCEILNNFNNLHFNHLGKTNSIEINKEKTIFNFHLDSKIKNYMKIIKNNINSIKDDFEKEFNQKRLSMFKFGLAEIKIGGNTKTEIREKHMRFQDALCAIEVASNGIIPGAGITFLQISNEYQTITDADIIIKKALEKPFFQILQNAGINEFEIHEQIKKSNFQKLYNINTNTYEDIKTTSVLDPTEVIINSLSNACSIAGMLLTTSSLIINEHQNNLNMQNEYNEL